MLARSWRATALCIGKSPPEANSEWKNWKRMGDSRRRPAPSVFPRWSAPRGSLPFARRHSFGRQDLEWGGHDLGKTHIQQPVIS